MEKKTNKEALTTGAAVSFCSLSRKAMIIQYELIISQKQKSKNIGGII
jgi:hypothetical protein